MSDSQNIGAVQWRILIDRCPENVKKMLLQYLAELKILLDTYPTPAMALMGDNVDHQVILPEVLKSIAHLRLKMNEVDMVLENSINMLSGYIVHLENKAAMAVEVEEESIVSGDIKVEEDMFDEPSAS